jgi:hypothetical protein
MRPASIYRATIHERVTEGTSEVGVPGIVPAVYLEERVLNVAARGTQQRRASR